MESYKLYNGKIILTFEPNKHIYSVGGNQIYGVTSITNVLAKPALIPWAANQAAECFIKNVKAGVPLDEVHIKELYNQIKSSHRVTKDKAADIGTLIHEWLHEFLKSGINKQPLPKKPINPEMKNAVDSFLEWTKKNKVKFLETERKVYSKKYKYAGTVDAVATVNGKPTIIDFKTSNAIYQESFLQTVAYQAAIEEEMGSKFTHNLILRLSKENHEKGIEPFEVLETTNHKENFKTFLACLQIYRWQNQNKRDAILKSVNGKSTNQKNILQPIKQRRTAVSR